MTGLKYARLEMEHGASSLICLHARLSSVSLRTSIETRKIVVLDNQKDSCIIVCLSDLFESDKRTGRLIRQKNRKKIEILIN